MQPPSSSPPPSKPSRTPLFFGGPRDGEFPDLEELAMPSVWAQGGVYRWDYPGHRFVWRQHVPPGPSMLPRSEG